MNTYDICYLEVKDRSNRWQAFGETYSIADDNGWVQQINRSHHIPQYCGLDVLIDGFQTEYPSDMSWGIKNTVKYLEQDELTTFSITYKELCEMKKEPKKAIRVKLLTDYIHDNFNLNSVPFPHNWFGVADENKRIIVVRQYL